MSYEKELAELRKEWKKSTEKYEEAIENGYDVDADMWSHDVMEIERQIYVYEQASKADEYEAKAIAFDFIREARKEVLKDVRERGFKLPADLDKFSMMTERIINKYESSESDE